MLHRNHKVPFKKKPSISFRLECNFSSPFLFNMQFWLFYLKIETFGSSIFKKIRNFSPHISNRDI